MIKHFVNFYRSYFFYLLFCVAILFLLIPSILKSAALFLVVEKPLTQVDAIVVLGGGNGQRVREAASHYHAGVSKKMFMTSGRYFLTTDAALMKDYAVSLGVKSDHIYKEINSRSTQDHVYHLEPFFKEHNVHSILIVTDSFHTRRSLMVFDRYYGKKLNIGIVSSDDGIDYDHWWKHHEMIQNIVIEWQKLIYYFLFL